MRERERLTSERQTSYVSEKKLESFKREIEHCCKREIERCYIERSESEMRKKSPLRERKREKSERTLAREE